MNDRKKEMTGFLLDEIGGIDESFVSEAENPQKKKKTPILRYAALIAACLVLVIGLVGLPRSFLMQKGDHAPEAENADPSIVHKSDKNNAYSKDDADKILTGESRILWQKGETTPVYCAHVGKEDTAKIRSLLGKGTPLPKNEAEKITVRIWIRFDDGKTVSPFLDPPDLYGFSPYEPTYMPCDELYDLLTSYIESEADKG